MQADDRQRLTAVRGSGLMLGDADPTFDRAARTAARCTGAPVTLVSVVGAARQHFVGQAGLPNDLAAQRGTPIESSRCRFVVTADAPVVADDAEHHPDLGSLPPMGGLTVGAYLGVPLRDGDGVPLGAVCAIDHAPHPWSAADITALEDVADLLQAHLTLRATTRALLEVAEARRQAPTPTRRRPVGTLACRTLPLPHRRR